MYVLTLIIYTLTSHVYATIPYARPDLKDRTYHSSNINNLIKNLSPLLLNNDLSTLLENCLPNSLDTTILYHTSQPNLDSFVITGDIEALWLRDSANQLIPYIPYAVGDDSLTALIEGLIARHSRSVLIDSFANAFNYNESSAGWQTDIRKPPMTPAVYEGKYEIDSLAAFLKLSYWYWRYSGTSEIFTPEWFGGVYAALNTMRTMQVDDGQSRDPPYLFQRETTVATDTLMMNGRGPPAHPNGLSRSLFRPSDDGVTEPYNIPGNAMACTELNHLRTMLIEGIMPDSSIQMKAITGANVDISTLLSLVDVVADGICKALDSLIEDVTENDLDDHSSVHGGVLPYEIDGYDSYYFMDDANVPSLLSLPVLGYLSPSHPIYKSTRNYVLSQRNPFYFSGTEGEGVGGPHEGYGYAWPMAIITRAMTSDNDEEITSCLDMLVRSAEDTGFMHEAFNVDNMKDYTRSWFAWANGLFGELVLQLVTERPHLVVRPDAIEEAQSLVNPPVCSVAQKETLI